MQAVFLPLSSEKPIKSLAASFDCYSPRALGVLSPTEQNNTVDKTVWRVGPWRGRLPFSLLPLAKVLPCVNSMCVWGVVGGSIEAKGSYMCLVAHSCLTLCDSMDCSLPDSFFHGILQARILEWVAIPFSRGSSRPKDGTPVSCIAVGFFTVWVTREAHLLIIFWPELPDWWKVILWPISLLYQDDAFYLIWVRCTIWGCACKSCMRLIRKTNRKTKQNLQSLWIPRKITQELDLKHYKYFKLIDLVSITIRHVLYDYKWICNSENLCSSQWWYHISFHLSVDKRAFSISQCRFWYTKQSAEWEKYVVRGPAGLMWYSSACRGAEAWWNLRALPTQLPWSASSEPSHRIREPKRDGLDSHLPLLWKCKPKGSQLAQLWGLASGFPYFLLMPSAIKEMVKGHNVVW